MTVEEQVRAVLRDVLSLGDRVDRLSPGSALLGSVPELDSMAVVNVLTMIEDEFGISIADDEVSGDIFATLGDLAAFVDSKVEG